MKDKNAMLPNLLLKEVAKRSMGRTMSFWLKLTLLFVGITLLLTMLRGQLGGSVGWFLFAIDQMPDAVTGYFPTSNGFELIFRLEPISTVAAFSLTYTQIVQIVVLTLLFILLIAPLKMATMERYWLSFQMEKHFPKLLRWYTEPKLLFKSVMVSLLLDVGCLFLSLLLLLPSLMICLYLAGGSWMTATGAAATLVSLLPYLSVLLTVAAGLLYFYVYTILYPIAYCLAAQPEYTLGKIFQRGLYSTKGYRKRFFFFRLSFLPFYIVNSLTMGVMDMYVFPYLSFSSFHFLQEVARVRQVE